MDWHLLIVNLEKRKNTEYVKYMWKCLNILTNVSEKETSQNARLNTFIARLNRMKLALSFNHHFSFYTCLFQFSVSRGSRGNFLALCMEMCDNETILELVYFSSSIGSFSMSVKVYFFILWLGSLQLAGLFLFVALVRTVSCELMLGKLKRQKARRDCSLGSRVSPESM